MSQRGMVNIISCSGLNVRRRLGQSDAEQRTNCADDDTEHHKCVPAHAAEAGELHGAEVGDVDVRLAGKRAGGGKEEQGGGDENPGQTIILFHKTWANYQQPLANCQAYFNNQPLKPISSDWGIIRHNGKAECLAPRIQMVNQSCVNQCQN